jgi:hypothetical protein
MLWRKLNLKTRCLEESKREVSNLHGFCLYWRIVGAVVVKEKISRGINHSIKKNFIMISKSGGQE